MWPMIVKEFRQLKRDRRTLAMLVILPVVLLVMFGYAANFSVSTIPTVVVGPEASVVTARLAAPFDVVSVDATGNAATATTQLRDGTAAVAFVTGTTTQVLFDGTQLFTVQAAEAALAKMEKAATAAGQPAAITPRVLFNPQLRTSWVMVPGLTGLILLFIGVLITSLGIVRERQMGTIEQLAVMPLRPWDVIIGKIVPYLLLAMADLVLIVAIGGWLFGVPFVGNVAIFALGAFLFLLVALGMGVLISTVSQNQGQSTQLGIMFVVPQILLSGLIFPLASMPTAIQWIAFVLPLSHYIEISRGVILKASPIGSLWSPLVVLAVMAVVILGLAMLRFRRDLAPSGSAPSGTGA